jgi:hypothetical protein
MKYFKKRLKYLRHFEFTAIFSSVDFGESKRLGTKNIAKGCGDFSAVKNPKKNIFVRIRVF